MGILIALTAHAQWEDFPLGTPGSFIRHVCEINCLLHELSSLIIKILPKCLSLNVVLQQQQQRMPRASLHLTTLPYEIMKPMTIWVYLSLWESEMARDITRMQLVRYWSWCHICRVCVCVFMGRRYYLLELVLVNWPAESTFLPAIPFQEADVGIWVSRIRVHWSRRPHPWLHSLSKNMYGFVYVMYGSNGFCHFIRPGKLKGQLLIKPWKNAEYLLA